MTKQFKATVVALPGDKLFYLNSSNAIEEFTVTCVEVHKYLEHPTWRRYTLTDASGNRKEYTDDSIKNFFPSKEECIADAIAKLEALKQELKAL